MISYQETPIQEIHDTLFGQAGVRLLVKREDLNHPIISGNKWWKLKYNLVQALEEKERTLLTFGGAYSNHIVAVAEAAASLGLKSIGIIRGERHNPPNPSLRFAESRGMRLHYISRELYREKSDDDFVRSLREEFGDFYLIPEGGTNSLAVKGTREFGEKLVREVAFDYVVLPVGTGGTLAGIIQALKEDQVAIGLSSLKGGKFLEEVVSTWVGNKSNWSIETRFHFGGFARTTPELLNFIRQQAHHLPLDPVYTAKTIFGIYAMIRNQEFRRGTTVLMIHTGGLQGSLQKN